MIEDTASSGLPRGTAEPRARRSLRWLPWIVGLALVGLVIAATLRFAEPEELARVAERAESRWLALAIVLQALTYLAAAQIFRLIARAGDRSLSLGAACRLTLAKLFVDQAVPSGGVSGTVLLASWLTRAGVPRPVVAAGIVIVLVSYYAAYVLSVAMALAILALLGEASTILVVASAVFFVFAIALSVAALRLGGRRLGAGARRWTRFRPIRTALDFMERADPSVARSPRFLLRATAYQLGVVLLDAATLWVLVRSLGADASISSVFASFTISSLVRTMGIMPNGLGTFEAASVVTLRMAGVPTAVALAATLLFRALSFWLPMLPGGWFSRRAIATPTTRTSAT